MASLEEFAIAYSILDGIPEWRLSLTDIANKPELDCGTLACGIGWLLLHPRYQERGFGIKRTSSYGLVIDTPDGAYAQNAYGDVAKMMFNLPSAEMESVFGTRHFWNSFNPRSLNRFNDKQLLLYRMRKYLEFKREER